MCSRGRSLPRGPRDWLGRPAGLAPPGAPNHCDSGQGAHGRSSAGEAGRSYGILSRMECCSRSEAPRSLAACCRGPGRRVFSKRMRSMRERVAGGVSGSMGNDSSVPALYPLPSCVFTRWVPPGSYLGRPSVHMKLFQFCMGCTTGKTTGGRNDTRRCGAPVGTRARDSRLCVPSGAPIPHPTSDRGCIQLRRRRRSLRRGTARRPGDIESISSVMGPVHREFAWR